MRCLFLVAVLMASTVPALADPEPRIEVISGNWVAIDYVDNLEVKVCGVGGSSGALLFRADADALEIRTSDPSWSLSADTTGEMTIQVGDVSKTFNMNSMGATTLASLVKSEDVSPIFDAMDKAQSLTLIYGGKKKRTVSLAGSTKAVNAFRACAGTHNFATLGAAAGAASTPFQ